MIMDCAVIGGGPAGFVASQLIITAAEGSMAGIGVNGALLEEKFTKQTI